MLFVMQIVMQIFTFAVNAVEIMLYEK